MGHLYVASKLDVEALNAFRFYRERLGLPPELPVQPKPYFAEIGQWADRLALQELGKPWNLFVTTTFVPVKQEVPNRYGLLIRERYIRSLGNVISDRGAGDVRIISHVRPISSRDFSERIATHTPSAGYVERKFSEFHNLLEARLHTRVSYLVGFEAGKLTGANHYHALLAAPGLEKISRMEELRPFLQKHYGRSLVLPFEPERGAGWYLAASYIGKTRLWWSVDVGIGRRVKHRPKKGGGQDVAVSPELPRDLYRLTHPRWHR